MMEKRACSGVVALALIWSSYIVLSKVAVSYLPVFMVGLLSRSVAVVGLSLLVLFNRQGKFLIKFNGKGRLLILIGVFAFLLDVSAFIGLRYSTAINGSILLRTDILFTIIIGHLLLRERLNRTDWPSITGMAIGSVMVMDLDLREFQFHYLGDMMFLVSAALIVCNAFIIKMKLADIQNGVIAFYNNLVATLCYLLFFLIQGDYLKMSLVLASPKLKFVLISMGVFDVLLLITYYYSLKRLPVWIVRTLLLLIPLFGIILSRVFLKEVMEPIQICGMAIVLLGALGIILGRRKIELAVST